MLEDVALEDMFECMDNLGSIAIGRQDLQFNEVINQRWVIPIREMNDRTNKGIHIFLFDRRDETKI